MIYKKLKINKNKKGIPPLMIFNALFPLKIKTCISETSGFALIFSSWITLTKRKLYTKGQGTYTFPCFMLYLKYYSTVDQLL